MIMRLYGFRRDDGDAEEPLDLKEVTFQVSPSVARRLAEFFIHVATEMEEHGQAFGHEHFNDWAREMRPGPDVVLCGYRGSGAEESSDG